MGRLPHLYPIISRLTGILLLVAGGLKAQETYQAQGTGDVGWQPALFAAELLFGTWLLVGLLPRWTRLLALGTFGVFLHVAFSRALEGQASCNCLGKVSLQPWVAVAIDTGIIVALLLCPAGRVAGPTDTPYGRARWGAFGLAASAVVVWFALPLLKGSRSSPISMGSRSGPAEVVTPVGQDQLSTLIDTVEKNHQKLENLAYTYSMTSTEQVEENIRAISKRPAVVIQHTTVRCVFRGADYRRDQTVKDEKGVQFPDGTEVIVYVRGRRIQSVPGANFASLSTAKSADQDQLETTDLRCAGFHPPIVCIADWLKACEVRSVTEAVDHSGRKVVRLRITAVGGEGAWKDDVEVDCVPGFNYYPGNKDPHIS